MKIKNKTSLMFILVFTGITLCYSQGWADGSIVLQIFTCTNQGPAADMTVAVHVSYNESSGIPENVLAVDTTVPDKPQPLKSRLVKQPYHFMKEKNPTDPKYPKVRAFPSLNTLPRTGSIICTNKNYPVFVGGDKAWFIYKE